MAAAVCAAASFALSRALAARRSNLGFKKSDWRKGYV